jgi:hypothetical protein
MKNYIFLFIISIITLHIEAIANAEVYMGKIDLSNAIITSCHADIGTFRNCFDGDTTTLMRTDVNPAWIQIEFPSNTPVKCFRVLIGQTGHTDIDQDNFWVESANSISDMNNKTGSFTTAIEKQMDIAGNWYTCILPLESSKKIWKIWIERTRSDNHVHIPEIEIYNTSFNISGLPATLQLYEGWTWRHLPGLRMPGQFKDIAKDQLSWISTNPDVAYVNSMGYVVALKEGTTGIRAEFNNTSSTEMVVTVKAAMRPPKHSLNEPFLSVPAEDALFEVPILIINFIPTKDNIYVDEAYSFHNCRQVTVDDLESLNLDYNKRIKFAIEQGSRYHNYKDSASIPSIGYRVLDYITVYESTPPGDILTGYGGGALIYNCDYDQIFNRFNVKDYIENKGVKEIWIWADGMGADIPCYDPAINLTENFRGTSESNMSSPVTGDISNSYRIPDLPIYNSSYIVIHQTSHRTQSTNMEPHTHQFESMLTYINNKQDGNTSLFWNDFVGKIGRCGWTHTPPNTEINYGYMSYIQHDTSRVKPVLSDIEDWKPDNSGVKSLVSYHNWEDKIFKWPDSVAVFADREELQWFMYWLQSIPGYNNKIHYGCQSEVTNWWKIIARWDSCNINNYGLYQPRPKYSIHPIVCDNYISPSGRYIWTSSGIYEDTIHTGGCDSIITIDLTINKSKAVPISQTSCGSYISPSGKYTWITSGTYTDTMTCISGCDSVIIIDLTVVSLDTSVTQSENELFSSSSDSEYQWLDCNNNYSIIPGATQQNFVAESNGNYAVRLSRDGCFDTSACYPVNLITFLKNDFGSPLKVYPNPTEGAVYVDLGENYNEVNARIKNISGQVLSANKYKTANRINFELTGNKGIYILEIVTQSGKKAILKIVKK